jgi:hypothetical protein
VAGTDPFELSVSHEILERFSGNKYRVDGAPRRGDGFMMPGKEADAWWTANADKVRAEAREWAKQNGFATP